MMRIRTALLCAVAMAMPVQAQAAGDPVPDKRGVLPLYQPAFPYGADATVASRDSAAPVVTLEEAIALAYWSNPNLQAERATLRSTDTLYPASRAAYGPQLTLQGRHEFARDRVETAPGIWGGQKGFSSTAALIFTQPIFSFGRRSAAEGSALSQIALGRNQLRLTEAQTMMDVITSYVSVIRDREALAISQENLALLEKQYSDSEERFRVREITSTDLQQVQTRVEFGRAQVLSAQGQLGNSQSRFLQDIGALPGTLAAPQPLNLGVATLDEAYAIAELNSPIIRAAQAREKISRAGIEQARAEQLPDVTMQSSGTYGSVTPYQNSLRTTEVRSSVVVTMPLIDSGVRRARIEQAKQANESDWRLIDLALRDTRQAVAGAWDAYRSTLQSLEHYRAASIAAQKAYEGAAIQEKAGDRTTLDVLDLARDLLNVRTNYVTAQANEFISRANLLAAMGNLEAPLLVPSIRSYDPEANFKRQQGRGDIPLLTPVLSGLDSVTVGNLEDDKPVRDPAGQLHTESAVPPPTTPVP
jgi:outer membrane protein